MSGNDTASDAAVMPCSDQYDPIVLSVMLGRFKTVVQEMTTTLEQSAWSSILSVCLDFSCAVYDLEARQISMWDALPIHTTSLHLVLKEIAKVFAGHISEGDVIMCNAPYSWNTHVGDLVTAAPVFVDGKQAFWSVTKGHQMDCGAFIPSSVCGSARDVWQEGLQIPPLKIYERGAARQDVLDLYVANMRYPDYAEGDLLAQLASIEKGRQLLVELCAEHGVDEVLRYVDLMMSYADRRMSSELMRMPDGVCEAETWLDSDGVQGVNIPIHVRVEKQGDEVVVDYSKSGPQGPGGGNGTFATSQAAGAIPFLYYVSDDIPHNDGCIRHVRVVVKEGTVCWAKYPGSTSAATNMPSDAMIEVVNRAMASVVPDLVCAGGTKSQCLPQLSGANAATGEAWGVMLFNGTGGSGAARGADGWPLYESLDGMGATRAESVEQVELHYPLLIDEMSVERDSMGFGEWNGGPGVRLVVRPIDGDMEAITFGDGQANPPAGVVGGTPGHGGGLYVEDGRTGRRRFLSATGHVTVGEADTYVTVSTGGGGYGNPVNRPAEQVRRDVRDGVVSRRAADEVFGVVLADDDDPRVNEAATAARRTALREVLRPSYEPATPGASTWLQRNMREGDVYLLNPVANRGVE